jgi:hypothetical protein
VVDAYDSDPLVHPKISARLLGAMLHAIEFAQAHASALSVKTLLVVAGDDRLVDASGSKAFFRKLAPGVGTMHAYPRYYPELFNEVEAGRVFDEIRAWLGALRICERDGIQPSTARSYMAQQLHYSLGTTALVALRYINIFLPCFQWSVLQGWQPAEAGGLAEWGKVPEFRQVSCQQFDKTEAVPVDANGCRVMAAGVRLGRWPPCDLMQSKRKAKWQCYNLGTCFG